MVGSPAHSGDTNRPGNTCNGFGASPSVLLFGESFQKPVAGANAPRCTSDVSAGPLRRAFPRPKWTGNGTQITYVAYISRVGMVLDHENKSDRLRTSFDRQAGRPGRFPGGPGREDPGHGHRPRRRAIGRLG